LTCLAEEQSNNQALFAAYNADSGYQIGIILRGTRYQCVLEGATITATPESTRFTYYLSSAEAYSFLILDDAIYGKLDNNKLGF
jgi:hypothetical protein